jgi:hypothetical protein
MAWWTTQLIFQGDKLVAEGIDPTSWAGLDIVVNGEAPVGRTDRYTRVIVSGYALYGQLRGYYALGVGHWTIDGDNGRVYTTEASQHHTEPVSSLTPKQRSIVHDCLINISRDAWETSNLSFRQALET